MRGHLFASAIAAAMVVGAPVVRAQRTPTPGEIQAARELFAKAEKDEDAGRWAAALEKLRRAASVKSTSGIRYHIALCEENTGQLAAALNDYSGAEAQAKTDHNRDVIELVGGRIGRLLALVPTLQIEVPEDAAGAEVKVDGNPFPVGLWGIATPMESGTHVVEATAKDGDSFRATVDLKPRAREHMTVLFRVPHPAVPPSDLRATNQPMPASSSSDPQTDGLRMAREEEASAALPPAPASRSRTAAVATGAGALALATLGVASYVVGDGGREAPRSAGWTALAIASWVGAAALGTTSVVLWTLPAPLPATVRLRLAPAAVQLAGTF